MEQNLLLEAIKKNNIPLLSALLALSPDHEKKDRSGTFPLPAAVSLGRTEAVKLLTKAGADIDAKDKRGRTSLMHASLRLRLSSLKALLERGADLQARDSEGRDESTKELLTVYGSDYNRSQGVQYAR